MYPKSSSQLKPALLSAQEISTLSGYQKQTIQPALSNSLSAHQSPYTMCLHAPIPSDRENAPYILTEGGRRHPFSQRTARRQKQQGIDTFPISILIPDISCVKQIEPIVFRDSAARVAAVFIKPITRSQRNLFPLPIHNILCRIMPPKFCAVPRLKRLPLKEYMIAALPINQAIRVIQQPNKRHDMKMLAVRIAVSDGLFFSTSS